MLSLAAFFNNLDPVAIGPIFGGISIRWYGLAYIAGFACAWFVMVRLAKRGLIAIAADRVGDAIMAFVVGTLVGGRLGYVLFYRPALLAEFDGSFPFWGLLKINEGGMASHGGMIGLGVAAWYVARKSKAPTLHVIDVLCLTGPIGVVFVRLMNFINGELLGRIVAQPGEAGPWWSVRYPTELFERPMDVQNADLREQALRELVVERGLWLPGDPFATALDRLLALARSGSTEAIEALTPLLSARHPTQLYQAFAEGLLTLAVVWIVWSSPRRPGVLAAWFFVVYGVGRVITEFWRLPDAHLETQHLAGLSRGQWLSVGLVVVGFALFAIIRKQGAERVGGWRRSNAVWAHEKAGDTSAPPA